MNIKLYFDNDLIPVQDFIFPGGEVYVRLGDSDPQRICWQHKVFDNIFIFARIQNSNDLLCLLNIKDALDRLFGNLKKYHLFLPYIPYARQDRVCNYGEPLSLKVFCKLINDLSFDTVIVCDPHSDVSTSLLDRCGIISQKTIIKQISQLKNQLLGADCLLVSPDSGANKKTYSLAKFFNHSTFIRADKIRNFENGEIKETIVYADDLSEKTIVCADDICDGGRTFIELAKVLKQKGCKKFILYVTHGIFSKGVETLLDNSIDEIYTTNSYKDILSSDKVCVFNVENLFERKNESLFNTTG